MFSLRTHALISGGLFAFFVLMAVIGNAVQSAGVIKHPEALQTPMKVVFFAIFLAFAFSMIPTMVKLFVAGQASVGNAEKAPVKFVAEHQVAVIWSFWVLWIAGIAVALPTMIQSGFFTDLAGNATSNNNEDEIARQIARTPVQGTLVAAPGMTVDEMIRGSSLKLSGGSNPAATPQARYAGGAIFDFKVAGTGIVFPRCRYYFVTTYTKDPTRIESIDVGTASAKMTRAQLNAANAALRSRLKTDGWLTGHEVYRDEQDRQLHGGKTRGEEGKLWLKGETTLDIEERRLDDAKPDEDPATAGEWIQYVDLFTRKDYPSIERYEFAAPGE
jgi:hypothetical protein